MKFNRYEHSFLWLQEPGVAYPCFIVNEVRAPIALSKEKNKFKLYMNDVGLLLISFSRRDRESIVLGTDSSINKGGIYENFVASMLESQSISPFYYKSKNIGKIDFLVDTSYGLTAIEGNRGLITLSTSPLTIFRPNIRASSQLFCLRPISMATDQYCIAQSILFGGADRERVVKDVFRHQAVLVWFRTLPPIKPPLIFQGHFALQNNTRSFRQSA